MPQYSPTSNSNRNPSTRVYHSIERLASCTKNTGMALSAVGIGRSCNGERIPRQEFRAGSQLFDSLRLIVASYANMSSTRGFPAFESVHAFATRHARSSDEL